MMLLSNLFIMGEKGRICKRCSCSTQIAFEWSRRQCSV